MQCSCGATEEIIDEIKGDHICKGCGKVKQGRNIVANLAFTDNQGVVGKFGSKNGEYSNIKSIWGISRDVDEIRLSKAYKIIDHLTSLLNLPDHIKEVTSFILNLP